MQDLQTTFVTNTCGSSFEKVCDAVYTDNPPFSCETTVYPTWLTIIATAFANASGAWSLAFLAIKLILRKTHFHFVHEFEYDRKKERYMNRDYSKIHTKDDYIAGEGPTVDYNAPSGSALRARWKNELVTENSPHLTYASNNNNQYEMVHPDPSGGDGETVNPLDTLESGGLIGFDGSKLSKYA